MMAAAQAAAEAALREVEERNQNDVQLHSAEPSEATLAAMLQQGCQGNQQGQSNPDYAMAFANEEHMQSFLQMMAQDEQQRQQIAALAAIAARPKEHYISIAQNGEFMSYQSQVSSLLSGVVCYLLNPFILFALSGAILEATETVMGIPPSALLMTSM